MVTITTPGDFSEQIHALVGGASDQELVRLVNSADCSVSLAAGWGQLLRTKPHKNDKDEQVLDEAATRRFLELVRRQVTVDPPTKWAKAIRTATCEGKGWVTFEELSIDPASNEAADHPKVDHTGQQWIVHYKDKTWSIPEEEDSFVFGDGAAVAIQDETAYVTVYDWPPAPYRLYAVREGKILWSDLVFAADHLLNYSGMGWHAVELEIEKDQIAVFGLSETIAYVEVFDTKTGDPICRFSTLYLADHD